MNKTRISIESVAHLGFKEDNSTYVKEIFPDFVSLRSEDKRVELRKTNNNNINYEHGWHLHVDNSVMQTIAACDVEYVEQVEEIMKIYKDY